MRRFFRAAGQLRVRIRERVLAPPGHERRDRGPRPNSDFHGRLPETELVRLRHAHSEVDGERAERECELSRRPPPDLDTPRATSALGSAQE